MNTQVWTEHGGNLQRQTLRQEAKSLHQMHQPPTELSAWKARREILRSQLMETMGSFPPAPRLDVRVHRAMKMKGYRIEMITFQSREHLRVTANLYVPDGSGPFPAVLNVHGHFSQGKIAGLVAARGHALAMEGFVVLCVDAFGAGERGTVAGKFEHHGDAGVPLFSIGESLMGMQVYDNMRAIDLLQSLKYVDGNRIGVTGASGGGNQTMWISAMDPRVKAAVPVVSAGTFESYVTEGNCWCETLPDGLKMAESWGVLGLIAPNPLLILTAQRDEIAAFSPVEMLRAYEDLRKIYALYDANGKLANQIVDQKHGYFPQMRRHMLGWFKHWLQDRGSALESAIPVDPTLPEAQLLCFPGNSRPADVKSLREYVSSQSVAMKKKLLSLRSLDRKQKIQDLAKLIRLPGGPDFLHVSDAVTGNEQGQSFEKFTIEVERNVLLPCVLLKPAKKFSSVVLAVHPDGKQACWNEKATQKILAQGKAVCLVDLRDTGETRWAPYDDQIDVFHARASLWVGRTMLGNWVKDLFAVRAALSKITRVKKIELLGYGTQDIDKPEYAQIRARGGMIGTGDAALAAIAAAALGGKFDRVTLIDLMHSYVLDRKKPLRRFSVYVPGMLAWGDVSQIAALAGSKKIDVVSLVNASSNPLSSAQKSQWLREVKKIESNLGKK